MLALVTACSDVGTITYESDDVELSVGASSLEVPSDLAEDGRIAEVSCPMGGMCPSTAALTVTCERSLCNPAPRTITAPVGDVIDFDALVGDLGDTFLVVDEILISEVSYTVQLNTFTVDLGEIEIFWGPEGAVDVDPALGVHRLATIPMQRARMTSSGMAEVDSVGSAMLSDYLVGSSRRIRLFVRTRVDLEPGDPLPEGEIQAVARMTVDVSGPQLIE
ncbi:MAG: hypothetical protein GWN73_02460 [Actinobacteria bacterium]|nr:hypothetical protein [Actinomycetota bacterium]NIU64353.1 hypothetical protein [Actinomycetota bacterium]